MTDQLARFVRRAEERWPRNKALRSAYVAGARARIEGRPVDACPYRRRRGSSWRPVWRATWIEGWADVDADPPPRRPV